MTAEKILPEEEISRSTAFHCHQSVEKAFKAVLENIECHLW
jgi:HEPN domain-containing protein